MKTAKEQADKMTEAVFANAMSDSPRKDIFEQHLIEFAKFHVAKALRAAYENAETLEYNNDMGGTDSYIQESSIMNAYPTENIK